MATLVEKREELTAKRQALASIFAEAGPELDLSKVQLIDGDSATKVAEIKRRNAELDEVAKEVERLDSIQKMAEANKAGLEHLTLPARGLTHPGELASGKSGGATGDHGARELKSMEDLFLESDAFRGYQKANRAGPVSEIKAPVGWLSGLESKTVLTETGSAPQAVRTGLILPGLLQRPRVADLIPDGQTDQIAIVYMEETTTTNATAYVAEGGVKPESALAFTERSSPVRKIATVLPVTDELLSDVPAMRSYMEARLRVFLAVAEDAALLTGNGTPPNITGLLNVSGIQTQAKGTDPTPDAVYKAMVKIQTSFLEPDGVIFHPLDWQDIRLLRTPDGLYIWGSPLDNGPERIWGLPVVVTTAITQNTALVGAFRTATQRFIRAGVAFAISSEHSDFFIRNQLMLRIEMREALVCYRPAGLATVTGV